MQPHDANNLNQQLDEIDSIQDELDSSERQTSAIRERLREAHRELRRIVNSSARPAAEG
jgi:predicted  nucleic acid-binding Zn-ribbon protein